MVAVDGAAVRAGLRPGDVILRVGNKNVKNAREFDEMLAGLESKKAVLLVCRGEITRFVPVKILNAR